jgi:glycerophosphoryl diester phosphodiesterase
MPLISHRGGGSLAPQNSKEGILKGDLYNPAYIEVDINQTSDGLLVMYHGEARRFVRGKCMRETYAEIKKKHPYVLTLDELGQIKPKAAYIFDIKVVDPSSLEKITHILKKQGHKNFALTSPHPFALSTIHKSFPKADVFQSQPYHQGPIAALEIARKYKFSGVGLNKWWLTPFVYNLCKIHGKKVSVYTIDGRLRIKIAQLLFPGVYIVTNQPDIYRKLFPND